MFLKYFPLGMWGVLIFLSLPSMAQESQAEQEVQRVIITLFKGMKEADSSMVKPLFAANARLSTVVDREEGALVRDESPEVFFASIAMPRSEPLDERILSYEIRVDGNMATAWTPYRFYIGERFSHCGVNAFQFYKSSTGWKIVQIIDTRRRTGCD